MRRAASIATSVVVLTLCSSAFAKQPAPAGAPHPSPSASDAPPATPVDDPMLAPVPPAQHVLTSWREALTLISAHDVDLNTAIAEVERARGERRQTLGQTLTQITAQGSVTLQLIRAKGLYSDPVSGNTTTITLPPSPQEDASLTVTQPILAPRVWYAIGTADKTIDYAKIGVEDTRRKLVGNVADAIVGVVSAEQVADINRSALKAALGRLSLTKRGVDLGANANIDVVRFEQDVTTARQALVDGDEALLEARETLGVTLGTNLPYGVASVIKLVDIETSTGNTCKPGPLKDRADLRQLYAKKELTEREVTDTDLEYSPTAEVVSTLAASSEPLVANGHGAWNVMGVLTIPIWDGGVRYGDRRVAKVDVTEANLAIQGAERQATIQLSQAERGVKVAESDRSLAETARGQNKEILRLAEAAYVGGTGTSFDLVDANDKLRQAELTLAGKELALTRAKIGALLATANCKY